MTRTLRVFEEKAVVEDWPAGQFTGKRVRFFEVIVPFVITQWGNKFLVRDQRKGNKRGGPDEGVWFNSEKEAWDYVHSVH